MSDPTSHRPFPGEQSAPVSFTREQRGWMVAALVAFVGVAILGPAVTAAVEGSRRLGRRSRRRLRRLGGGTIAPLRRQVAALRR